MVGKLSGHTGNIMTMAVSAHKNGVVVTGGKDHFIKVGFGYVVAVMYSIIAVIETAMSLHICFLFDWMISK